MPDLLVVNVDGRRNRLGHGTLGAMNRSVLVVAALCAGLIAGCGSNAPLTLTQVERRVAKLVGDNQGGHAEAKCVELSEDRAFRCDVSVNAVPSTYDARVSKHGERIELDER